MKINLTEAWFTERNLFDKTENLPSPGEYEGWFIGVLPIMSKWRDKDAVRYCFLILYKGKQICPCFINKSKIKEGLPLVLYYILIGDGSSKVPEEVNWNLLAGRSLRIQVEVVKGRLGFFPRVIDVHPLR